jgi:hypothetical protein
VRNEVIDVCRSKLVGIDNELHGLNPRPRAYEFSESTFAKICRGAQLASGSQKMKPPGSRRLRANIAELSEMGARKGVCIGKLDEFGRKVTMLCTLDQFSAARA